MKTVLLNYHIFPNDSDVPKARIARADINGCYLEAAVQFSPVKGLKTPKQTLNVCC